MKKKFITISDIPNIKWQRSKACGASTACVQIAKVGDNIAVSDSKDPNSAVLFYNKEEWEAFVTGVKKEEFEF